MRKYCAMDYVFLVTVKVKPKKYFSKIFDKNLKRTTSCSKLQLRFPSTKTVAQKLLITYSWPQLKVRQFQNEFMKSSFLPKYEQKIVRISALCSEGRNKVL